MYESASPEAHNFSDAKIDQDLIDALAQKKPGVTAETIEDIEDISDEIYEEISGAKRDKILTKAKDDKEVQAILRDLSSKTKKTDRAAVIGIKSKTEALIKKNVGLNKAFEERLAKVTDVNEMFDVQDQVELFRDFTTAEKEAYMRDMVKVKATLESKITWVQELFDQVKEFLPDELRSFREGSLSEKKKIGRRAKNVGIYKGLMEVQGEAFESKESANDWITQFARIQNLAVQEHWIKALKTGKSIEAKKEVIDRYKDYPKRYRDQHPEFLKSRKEDKLKMLDEMDESMVKDYEDIFTKMDPDKKHLSESDQEFAKKSWHESPMKVRILMMNTLPDHLKEAAKLTKKFEALGDDTQKALLEVSNFVEFYDCTFEAKVKMLETGDKIKEQGIEISEAAYTTELEHCLQKEYISESTFLEFKEGFKGLQTAKEKKAWMKGIQPKGKEFEKRKKVTLDFKNQLPPEVQAEHSEFYTMGFTGRDKLLKRLLKESLRDKSNNSDASRLPEAQEKAQKIARWCTQAAGFESAGTNLQGEDRKLLWGKAIELYGKILDLEPGNDQAERNYDGLVEKYQREFRNDLGGEAIQESEEEEIRFSENEFENLLEDAASDETIKKQRKAFSIYEVFAEYAKLAEEAEGGATIATQRQRYIEGGFRKQVQRQLTASHGMMLNKETDTAEDVIKFDPNAKEDQQNESTMFRLQKVVSENRTDERKHKMRNVQGIDKSSGKAQGAKVMEEKVATMEEGLQNQALNEVLTSLRGRGVTLNAKEMALLRKLSANQNMTRKIEDVH